MNPYFILFTTSMLPVAVSMILYAYNKKAVPGQMKKRSKDIFIGVIFGGLSVIGSEFGVNIGGAQINTRDAAALTAGLMFSPMSGVLAGLIGGVERYFSVYWGGGAYTQIACSVSTVLAGLIGAGMRKYMFEDKRPSTLYALAIGLMTEVLHMMMVFFTNMSDVVTAFRVVEQCAVPMIALNGLSVMLSAWSVSFIEETDKKQHQDARPIIDVFQRWLLLCIIVGLSSTSIFTAVLQYKISENNANQLLELNIEDVMEDISDASDENLLELTRKAAYELRRGTDIHTIARMYSIAEINIIDENGIIVETTHEPFLNYDMKSGKQSSEFLDLLSNEKECVQRYQPTSYDSGLYRKYAGIKMTGIGIIQVGYDARYFQADIDDLVVGAAKNRHVGKEGCIIIADENWKIVSDRHNNEGENLETTGIWIDRETMPERQRFEATVYGQASYCM